MMMALEPALFPQWQQAWQTGTAEYGEGRYRVTATVEELVGRTGVCTQSRSIDVVVKPADDEGGDG